MQQTPSIHAPFCSQAQFERAISTIRKCLVTQPAYGFTRPFFAPGGDYGECWWSLDAALAVDGYKWIDPDCERSFVYNLIDTQLPDGRVKLYGKDDFSHIPSVKEPIGSLPRFLETCANAALRHADKELMNDAYRLIERNLIWWFNNRQDPVTKLISAVFEETFLPNLEFTSMEYCPVDTNIQIAAGCRCAAGLAAILGDEKRASFYNSKSVEILCAVHKYLWDDKRKAYYPYLLSSKTHYPTLIAHGFEALRFNACPADHHARLISMLTDESLFGWASHGITTVAKNDPAFCAVEGPYNGNPSWSGSIWTLTNKAVINALSASGEASLSAQLACSTLNEFRGSYTEFLHPFTGEGHGVIDYAWTAAQFIQIIIEDIFGISYDGIANTVTVRPNLTSELKTENLSISGLRLPNGEKVSVDIEKGQPHCTCTGNTRMIIL